MAHKKRSTGQDACPKKQKMGVQTQAHSTGPSLIIRCKENINSVVGYKKETRKKEEEREEINRIENIY